MLKQTRLKTSTGTIQRTFDDNEIILMLYGEHGKNLKIIEKTLHVAINVRGNQITFVGDQMDIELADKVCSELYDIIKSGYPLYPKDIEFALRILTENPNAGLKAIFQDKLFITSSKRIITPKSINQNLYIEAIRTHDIVFGIGPAGTGKTYLAMVMAVSFLLRDQVKRIILTRPAVEAGEKLGFLPGDLVEKVNPYLRPLYDALYDILPFERVSSLIERQVIEIAPLAFMRGRTLNDAFVILDEAQNTTSEQMKMFLTRLGFHSKAVVTGDITQIDLPEKRSSGLIESQEILNGIEGISFIHFTKNDVIRHRLVSQIIEAYENKETRLKSQAQK
ncbi:MAG: PhoH family protein [Dissulfurimicrobium sp.]|uniref:PhoH family protein n=1 Tax=Dissulfurimicrobium sp. TaxID=2022436 RepID=UPI00404B43D3